MILILADSTDPWGVALSRRLALRGEPYVIQDPRQMRNLRSSMMDQAGHWAHSLTGVYRGVTPPFSEEVPACRFWSSYESESDWLSELNSLPCPVVNRLSPGGVSPCPTGSPAWEAVVRAHGFQVPRLHPGNNRDEAMSWWEMWGGAVYVKPRSSEQGGLVLSAEEAASYACTFNPNETLLLAQVSIGQLVSVFVIGGAVAATVVRSGWWTDSTTSLSPLGATLLTRCSDMAQSLELSFAECLLGVGADGQVSCLDVIGAPNYWSCPGAVHSHVIEKLAVLLSGGGRRTGYESDLKGDGVSNAGFSSSVRAPDVR